MRKQGIQVSDRNLVVYGNATLEEDSPNVGFYQVMEWAVLTVAEGVVLDMSHVTADKIILDGTVLNDGTVVLPDSYTYATIPAELTGGTVIIGESTYIWNGEKYVCGNHVDADNSGRCDNCNELMQPAKLCFASISLKGNIALNYYMLLSDEVLSDSTAHMRFAIQGFNAASGQGTELAKFYSASLILKSETTLRFFFTAPITATYNGQALEVKQRSGLYYVDVVGIAAKELDENVTITVNDGVSSADVTYNPMVYCTAVLNDTTGAFSAEMKDLVRALYLYNQAENTYFKEN